MQTFQIIRFALVLRLLLEHLWKFYFPESLYIWRVYQHSISGFLIRMYSLIPASLCLVGLKNTITKQSATGSIPITLAHSSEMIRLLLPNYELNSAEYANQSTLLHLSVNNNNLLLTGFKDNSL